MVRRVRWKFVALVWLLDTAGIATCTLSAAMRPRIPRPPDPLFRNELRTADPPIVLEDGITEAEFVPHRPGDPLAAWMRSRGEAPEVCGRRFPLVTLWKELDEATELQLEGRCEIDWQATMPCFTERIEQPEDRRKELLDLVEKLTPIRRSAIPAPLRQLDWSRRVVQYEIRY